MEPFEPDFELIKMDAEIASYQEDFEPDERGDAASPGPAPTEGPFDETSG